MAAHRGEGPEPTADPSRDLLFGLFALQTALIDQRFNSSPPFKPGPASRAKAGRWPTISSTAAISTPTSGA
jgi:hypothetical protein